MPGGDAGMAPEKGGDLGAIEREPVAFVRHDHEAGFPSRGAEATVEALAVTEGNQRVPGAVVDEEGRRGEVTAGGSRKCRTHAESRRRKFTDYLCDSASRREIYTRKIAPSFLPRMRLAPRMQMPRKTMAQTPSALAMKRPSPRSW